VTQEGAANAPAFFLIATEESGDRLGAALITALRQRLGSNLQVSGIGGSQMQAEGVASLFPIDELSIIGVSAIARKLPMILQRLRQATDAVLAAKPDVLVIIDSPDFTHRVAKRVRAANPDIGIVNYVSPSVWAWRPGRANAMRRYVDLVLALLPFETAAHAELGGPPCIYVGHPLTEQLDKLRPNGTEAARRDAQPPVLLVLPGSRRGEIKRHMEAFGGALAVLRQQGIAFDAILPTMPHLENSVRSAVAAWPVKAQIVVGEAEKTSAFRIARAALAKSGTVTLELALAGVPMIAAYKGSAIEAWIARRVVRVPSIILANLVVGENIVPEILQEECTAENLAAALKSVLADSDMRETQLAAFQRLDAIMATGSRSPSELAADAVLSVLDVKSA
jgi:lipid-A-disaccharide synthase